MKEYEILCSCLESVRLKTNFIPETAIVLGSGLGEFAEQINCIVSIRFDEVAGLPVSTVQGHNGRFIFGYVGNMPVVAMQGRIHYYEGYSIQEVVRPIRLMGMLGADKLILTNASGAINKSFAAGELMLIIGQISSFVPNPLRGANIDELGTRFPDMTQPYDRELAEIACAAAKKLGIKLNEGVYCQLSGPSFETPQEIKMLSILGADAVGMSTVCETIAARHIGMRVCGISCISNMAAGIAGRPLSHQDVMDASLIAGGNMGMLITEIIDNIKTERH